jgi:hypothetical protein
VALSGLEVGGVLKRGEGSWGRLIAQIHSPASVPRHPSSSRKKTAVGVNVGVSRTPIPLTAFKEVLMRPESTDTLSVFRRSREDHQSPTALEALGLLAGQTWAACGAVSQ